LNADAALARHSGGGGAEAALLHDVDEIDLDRLEREADPANVRANVQDSAEGGMIRQVLCPVSVAAHDWGGLLSFVVHGDRREAIVESDFSQKKVQGRAHASSVS
jgi:hypothetical protein